MQTLNDFQRSLGDISHIWCTIGICPDDLNNLNHTLDGDKGLYSTRELSAKDQRTLAFIEEKLQKTHLDHVDLNLNGILVILHSKHLPTRI